MDKSTGTSDIAAASAHSLEEASATVVATNLLPEGSNDIEMLDTEVAKVRDDSKPHAFIVMPFGIKKDREGNDIDFDRIYSDIIKPAVIAAEFEPKRADEEFASGDIHTDMFQELLLADMVVADMSIDNANVFYELGVRHALRRRGIVHIQAGRSHMPFDVFNVRTIQYRALSKDDVKYNEQLQKDTANITRAILNTWKSDLDAIHSPVFNLLTGLQEPDRKQLATPLATGFWREQTEWEERIDIAQREKSVGDILLLTEEITNPLIKEDALTRSGLALDELGRKKLALKEFRKGLVMNPRNRLLKTEIARIQSQLGRVDAAIVRLERLLLDEPDDARAIRTLGRIYSDLWRERWKGDKTVATRRTKAFEAYHWLIKSIRTYLDGFYSNLNVFEPGIKALVLCEILSELASEFEDEEFDCSIAELCELKTDISSAVHFAIEAALRRDPNDYWAHVSKAEWEFYCGTSNARAVRTYQSAISHARGNMSYLKKSLIPLEMARALGIRVERAELAIAVLQQEVDLIGMHGISKDDNRSIVFSGLPLYDSANKTHGLEKLTEEQERELIRRIDLELEEYQSFYDRPTHAFVNGISCLGAMAFVECCTKLNITVHIFLPLEESQYIRKHLTAAGDIDRYYRLKTANNVFVKIQHERLGALDNQMESYKRNMRWTVLSALQASGKGLHLLALSANTEYTLTHTTDQISPANEFIIDQCRDLGGSYTLIPIRELKLLNMSRDSVDSSITGRMSLKARVNTLRKCVLLRQLHKVDLEIIAAVCTECNFSAGEDVLQKDDLGRDAFILVEGEVAVKVDDVEIDRRKAGDVIGEMSIYVNDSRTATVKATQYTYALKFSGAAIQELIEQRPHIESDFVELYQKRKTQLQRVPEQKTYPVKSEQHTTEVEEAELDAG